MKIFDGIAIPDSIKICVIKELASETTYPEVYITDTIIKLVNKYEFNTGNDIDTTRKWYRIQYGDNVSYLNLNTRELSYVEPVRCNEIININVSIQEIEKNIELNLNIKRKLFKYLSENETTTTDKNLVLKFDKIVNEGNLVYENAGINFYAVSEGIRLNRQRKYAENEIDKIYNEYLYDLNNSKNFTLPLSRFSTNIFLLQSQMIFGNWAKQNIYLLNEPTAIKFCKKLIKNNNESEKLLQFFQFGNDYFESANRYLQKSIKSDGLLNHICNIRIAAHYFWVANMIGLVAKNNNLSKENMEYSYLNAEEGWACCVTALKTKNFIYEHPNWFALIAKDSILEGSNFVRQYSSPTNPIIPRIMAEVYYHYGHFLASEDKDSKELILKEVLAIRNEKQKLGTSELQIIDLFITEMYSIIGDNDSSNYYKKITIKRYLTYKLIGN